MTDKNKLYDERLPKSEIEQTASPDSDWIVADDYSIYKEIEYGVSIDDSIIYLNGDIVQGFLIDFIMKVRLILNNRNPEFKLDPITLVINSDGGEAYEALGMIDYIQGLDVKVNAIARGRAMSAAALLLTCATGTRAASKHTHIMVHELSSGGGGSASDIKTHASHIDQLDTLLYELLGKYTKFPSTHWQSMARKDYYMTAEKAVEMGIIDQLV